jgi:hypothetical protein
MLRRLAISLFMEWRGRQAKPHFQSLTDFQATMGEDTLQDAYSAQPAVVKELTPVALPEAW